MNGSNGSLQVIRQPADRLDEAELVPDLQHQVDDLTRALKCLVAATGDTSVANREAALATARRVLARTNSRSTAI
jgi:hypothetical protein